MQASTSPSELQAPASVVPQPATPAAQALSAVSETQASAAQTDSRDQVRQSIERWSRAWSARDVNTYLDAYARSFVPAGGQDKAAWEQTRRQRILSKSAIAHEIRNLQITLDGNKATARFEQTYTADHLRSVGPKTLQLELNGDKWLIVSESAS
ncbi:MAG: YybH family protein [Limnohabitans sp.]